MNTSSILFPTLARLRSIVPKKPIYWFISLLALSGSIQAGVTGLPDAVQPGAQRPSIDSRERAPASTTEEVVEIPAVVERPLDIDEGERILVERFSLKNVEDLPEQGITVMEVETIVEDLRQQRPQGFTVGRLQEVADTLTRYYRDRGLFLAQAVIPVQDVVAGEVLIEVFVGYLGRVLVEGNEHYDGQRLANEFQALLGQPIIKDEIEAVLLRLTDFPGLSVYGVFQPGETVGTADIVLNVSREDRVSGQVRADNHGVQESGRVRGRLALDWNSLAGSADRLSLLVQQTYRPKENHYFSFDYVRYLRQGWALGGNWGRSDYSVGGDFADQQITGDADDYSLFIEKSLLRSRTRNLLSTLRFTHSESTVDAAGVSANREQLSVFNLGFLFDAVDGFDPLLPLRNEDDGYQPTSLTFLNLEISQGMPGWLGAIDDAASVARKPTGERPFRQGGSGAFPSGEFTKLFFSATRFQGLTDKQSLLLRSELQWSDDLLLSQEQYAIGGPNSVRAFAPSFQLVDQAAFVSVEYILDFPLLPGVEVFDGYYLSQMLQISAYYDLSVGKVNDPGTFDEIGWKSYQGVGLGLDITLPNGFSSRFLAAWPLGVGDSGADSESGNGREPQLWLDINYAF